MNPEAQRLLQEARAELVTEDPLYTEGVHALTLKYPQYREQPLLPAGSGLVILIHIETVRSWRSS